jgi:hypothetical protein
MLSSYIPGGTGPLHLHDKVPDFLSGLFDLQNRINDSQSNNLKRTKETVNDTVHRAGARLRLMEIAGLVKHGKTGLPQQPNTLLSEESTSLNSTDFWDGGIADVFPTFDEATIIIAPVNGVFTPNPAICPIHTLYDTESNETSADLENDTTSIEAQTHTLSPMYLQSLIRSKLPTTFRHCQKAQLGLNTKNVKAALKMIFSSEEEDLYQIFREGYDDAR